MEIVPNSYIPGDPRLVEQLVYELKSQGIFDQFRKECIADVDTKPAYQNLRQRVEGSVTSFLSQQTWRPDMNKNQVREQLRKNIYESGYLETGVERIVDQVVNPKINSIFLPQVEDVVYSFLGIEKPNRYEVKKELKIDVTDLLPTDLEAISPESDHTKDDSLLFNDSLNSESKMEEDESPPFEPIDLQQNNIPHEENSVDSHLSGFSGLQSHDSNPCMESKIGQMELSNQDSQVSQNSSESRLSIITSEDNTKMEIREDSNSKLLKSSDSSSQMEIDPPTNQILVDTNPMETNEEVNAVFEAELNPDNGVVNEKVLKTQDDEKREEKVIEFIKNKEIDQKPNEDRKHNEKKYTDKKYRSSDKHSSKDKRDDKHRKSSSNSNSRDKEKSSSKYSSSSSSKERDKIKDKKESRSNSNSNKDKDRNDKDDYKNEKDRDKVKSDKEKDKEKSEKEKDRREDRDKKEKDKCEKDKSKATKDKSVKDKDKGKNSSSNSSSSVNKNGTNKEKDKSSSSSKSDSSRKDKEKSRLSSSSSSKDSKSKLSDSKSKSSSDKHKRDDKSSHSLKHSSSSSSSSKKDRDSDRDKKKVSKKDVKDDHYSSKDKKNDRRSTDRDSNDGKSGRQSQINSFTDSNSSQTQKSNQESSNSNSGSGSGDSGTSDHGEQVVKSPLKIVTEHNENKDILTSCIDPQKFKYLKPKFASNFQEARKLMKIRKQLAKLERHNQLSLTQIEIPTEMPVVNGVSYLEKESIVTEIQDKNVEENVGEVNQLKDEIVVKVTTPEITECKMSPKDDSLLLQSKELSKENWEALEARLAQEMSNINYDSYESPYDDDDYGECNLVNFRKTEISENCIEEKKKIEIMDSKPQECESEEVKDEHTVTDEIKNSTVEQSEKHNAFDSSDSSVAVIPEENQQKIENTESNAIEQNEDSQKDATVIEHSNNEKSDSVKEIENVEDIKVDTDDMQMVIEEDKTDNVENTGSSDSDSGGPCTHLEPPSPRSNANLQFLDKYIEKLEQNVKHSLKTFQNNFVPAKPKFGKRKLVENVDMTNNNKAHYEQSTDVKKRRRSIAPNLNSVISKANKVKLCNSSDISPNDSFSLPLSPAESDKSNDKKEEESPKAKQKREKIGRSMTTRNQRYSSEDLYKPRPVFISSRRSRGAKNVKK